MLTWQQCQSVIIWMLVRTNFTPPYVTFVFHPVTPCRTPQWLGNPICSWNCTHNNPCKIFLCIVSCITSYKDRRHTWTRANNYLFLWRFFHQVGPLSRGCSGPVYPISKHFSLNSCSSPKSCASKQTNASLVLMRTSLGCSLLPCVAILLSTQFESHFFFSNRVGQK